MPTEMESLRKLVVTQWDALQSRIIPDAASETIDGSRLDVASVLAVSRYSHDVELAESVRDIVEASVRTLQDRIETGEIIYGINTGFGGSADTRSKASQHLKEDLLGGLQYGTHYEVPSEVVQRNQHSSSTSSQPVLPLDHQIKACMPESWVRASILVRVNSLAKGASGVQWQTLLALLVLLARRITPVIPLRGSISASGDLSPLSYVAAVLEGKPSSSVFTSPLTDTSGERHVEPADEALAVRQIPSINLGTREALALVNGTSVSAAVAALASHEAMLITSLAHVLTAMSVEALRGTDEPFDSFFTQVRPHRGQSESASTVLSLLSGSSLVWRNHSSAEASLRQDRYSIRTASQWIGPCIEDLLLAHEQITIELNSATDNPLIDSSPASTGGERILHGGNFQAKSITSAVEKIRQAAQSVGRMLFTQCTELINPATSRGLPPNLVVAEPSENFIFKGTDILIAALLSELGFLANPVGAHVQSAEMGNQALNSLALISARYTMDSLDILAQLAAAHLLAVCQALDLRALNARFVERLSDLFAERYSEILGSHLSGVQKAENLKERCWISLLHQLEITTTQDSHIRIPNAINSLQPLLLDALPETVEALCALKLFTRQLGEEALRLYIETRNEYLECGSASELLGRGTRRLYQYVRKDLSIPFIGPGTLPGPTVAESSQPVVSPGAGLERGFTIGDLNGRIRKSMADGGLYGVVVECLREC